jgi:hypothetical protein
MLQYTQATGQKRPDIGQLSWPVTVPVNGMLRQFPGAGNLFSMEKNFWERQYSILRTHSHDSVALPPELPGHTNTSLSTFLICPLASVWKKGKETKTAGYRPVTFCQF